jgi:hypothetical protein
VDEAQIGLFIDEILTMPDPQAAQALALSNRRVLLSPMAFRLIALMEQEEQQAHGESLRRQALRRLRAFRQALITETMVGGALQTQPLPTLLVVSDHQRDRFRYWLERIEGAGSDDEVNEPVGVDWLKPMQRVLQLDQRHTSTLPKTMFGHANEGVITELKSILQGYRAVLEAGIPNPSPISVEDVQRRCAQVLDSLGRGSDALERYEEAYTYYEAAYRVYEELGDEQQVTATRERLARVRLAAQGDIDAEVLRLQATIEAAPAVSLQRVNLLVELVELYQRGGDDFSSTPLLEKAQKILSALGFDHPAGPSGRDLAGKLAEFAMAARSDDMESRAARLQEVLLVRSLYLRIYLAWVQIYQGRREAELAERYRSLAADLDSKEMNLEFSQQMLSMLPKLFAGDDSGAIDKKLSTGSGRC